MRILITLLLVALLVPPVVLEAVSATVGDRIELKATNPAGVPLHNVPRGTHDFQRVPDGATATAC